MSAGARLVRAVRPIMAGVLFIALAGGLVVTARTWTIDRAEAWAGRELGGPSPPPWTPPPRENACRADCPPAALAASAVLLTVRAGQLADPTLRRQALAEADRRLTRALQIQPAIGGWWSWLAYVRLREGRHLDAVAEALSRSYAAAPFLMHEGPWRARVAALNWSRLDPGTRARLVDEAVWLRDVNPDAFASVAPAFSDPPAMRALAEGLRRPPRLIPHRVGGAPGGVGPSR